MDDEGKEEGNSWIVGRKREGEREKMVNEK